MFKPDTIELHYKNGRYLITDRYFL